MAKKQEDVTWLGEKKSKRLARTFGIVLFLMVVATLLVSVPVLAQGFIIASTSPKSGSLEEAFAQLFIGCGIVLSLWAAYYLFCGIEIFRQKFKKVKMIVCNAILMILAVLQTVGGGLLISYWSDRTRLIGGIVLLFFGLAILVMAGLSIADVTVKPKTKVGAEAEAKADSGTGAKKGAKRKS